MCVACVCVRSRGCVCVCLCLHARQCLRMRRCARVCATQGGSWDARLVLEGYSRGTRGVLKRRSRGTQGRTLASVKRSSTGSLRLIGCTPSVRACDTGPLLGCMTHHTGDARHCTGAFRKLAPPSGYSTSTHVGLLSCGPSLRVRLRRDALAEPLDAHACALANARAGDRRAGRCSVEYELS
jgi:hypothetical protein